MIDEMVITDKREVMAVQRIHGFQTVSFAWLVGGGSIQITDDEYEILADALRPTAYHVATGWVEEVLSVVPVVMAEVTL